MKLFGRKNRGGFAFRELVVIEKPEPYNGLRGASLEMGGRYLDWEGTYDGMIQRGSL
jgi:hypothetical protein